MRLGLHWRPLAGPILRPAGCAAWARRAAVFGLVAAFGAGCSAGSGTAAAGRLDAAVLPGPSDLSTAAEDASVDRPELPTAVHGFREVAGLTTGDAQVLRPGLLFRAGHLADLDAAGCAEVQELGLSSVIDLRSAAEAAALPDAVCVTHSVRHMVADLPKILPPSAASYAATLDAVEPKLAGIFEHFARPAGLPLLVHCVIGRDRANLMMALVLVALGVPREQIEDDFLHNQAMEVDPTWLAPLFARLEEAGGAAAYFAQHGVSASALAELRAQALESQP